MIPSSTGCEQSMVNLSVCFRLVIFFALATCEQSGIVDTVIETASDAKGGRRHGEERRTAAGMGSSAWPRGGRTISPQPRFTALCECRS